MATCVSHGLNPREYLTLVTDELLRDIEDVGTLLPDRIVETHPELQVPDLEAPILPD